MPLRKPVSARKSAALPSNWLRRYWRWIGAKGWIGRWFWRGLTLGLVSVFLAWVAFELYFGTLARGYEMSALGKMPARSLVLDSQGTVIGKLHGENRLMVTKDQVASCFYDALLAREDDRFYHHGGVDWIGVLRATVRNVKDRRAVQGASTITMQLARNSYGLSEQKTLHRKLLEIGITKRIESTHTKDQILEAYVNRIFFGNGIYGVERASQVYFGKRAADLQLDEAAMLAGIIRGPNRFSPFRNLEGAIHERNTVLDRMVEKERLSAIEAAEAKSVTTRVKPPPKHTEQESYALDAVQRDLAIVLDMEDIEDGGLKIYTTIDSALQKTAERALETRLSAVEKQPGYSHQTRAAYNAALARSDEKPTPEYLQGALLLLENQTGAIRAMVGGRDYTQSSYNRALTAKRQVGSTFKPLVFAAGVEHAGLLPSSLISDDAIQPGEITSAEGAFSPGNSDGTFTGWQSLETGLARSRNTMTVRVGERAGIEKVVAMAEQAGITEITGRSPQIYIGNLGATLKSMTSAFSVFANAGQRCRPYVIDRIETAEGEVVFRSGVIHYEVVSPGTAHLVNGMMQKVMQPSGTGAGVKQYGLTSPLGGKTGTTDDYKDAWFIGFNPSHTCGVWVGMDRPERIVGQGYGGKLALPIWADVMKQVEKLHSHPAKLVFPKPALSTVSICPVSGMLASPGCPHSRKLQLPDDRIPTETCLEHADGIPPIARPSAPASKKSLWDRIKGIFR